ncbi:MAG TPA: DUF4124 domain-containing protein [Rhodanobacteraceae bacterium]|nr:DUF4124 domain-containing protein [Rhodanobacteraceae bacterium]
MLPKLTRFLCLLLLALLSTAALAAQQKQDDGRHLRYRWTDGAGHLHISDMLPADASRFGYDLIDDYGRVLRHVNGTRTPEQIAAAKAAAEAAAAARKQRRNDEQLLLAYPTEADLVSSQEARKKMLGNSIASIRQNMKSQLDALASLLDQAAGYSERGKPVPKALRTKVDAQRAVVRKQRGWLQKKQAELEVYNNQAQTQLAHYRTLRPAPAASAGTPGAAATIAAPADAASVDP